MFHILIIFRILKIAISELKQILILHEIGTELLQKTSMKYMNFITSTQKTTYLFKATITLSNLSDHEKN